jgi:hypothetical protein
MKLRLLGIGTALLLILGIAHPVSAAPVIGRGIITVTPGSFQVIYAQRVGLDTILYYIDSGTFSGAISGTYQEHGTVRIDDDGNQTVQGTDACYCTVLGRFGGYFDSFTGIGTPYNGVTRGRFAVSGVGGLAGLSGQGTFAGTFAATTYTVTLNLPPLPA